MSARSSSRGVMNQRGSIAEYWQGSSYLLSSFALDSFGSDSLTSKGAIPAKLTQAGSFSLTTSIYGSNGILGNNAAGNGFTAPTNVKYQAKYPAIAGWVRLNSTGSNSYILQYGTSVQYDSGFSSGQWRMRYRAGGGARLANSGFYPVVGVEYFLLCWFDETQVWFYVNGQLFSIVDSFDGAVQYLGQPLYVDCGGGGTNSSIPGMLREVAIFDNANGVLTKENIADYYAWATDQRGDSNYKYFEYSMPVGASAQVVNDWAQEEAA